ncbi:MAG: OB-fold nucleic acid binding domain-containing protein [Actinomycetota bacterium]|nr:OB-fold nucleic acid binding domain-containing protein [Actinomycetota bacterium]
MGKIASLLDRLTASTHHLDAAELRSEVVRLSCVPIGEVQRGSMADLTGRIRAVVYTPAENVATLEAELFDGTGSLDLVWLGRRRIAGIEPGRRLKARGRVGLHDGRLAMYNPAYELQAGA